jgi:trk system potassium uptake protein TrkA
MKILIIGSGKMLYFLCRVFNSKGYEVVIINRNHDECVELARQLKGTVVCGDGSESRILKEAGAMSADVLLAITHKDQENLVICQLAALQYQVPRTIALANDPDNVEVFEKLGVSAFSTIQIIISMIEQRVALEEITNLLPVGEGKVNVTEISIDDKSPVIGKKLKEIDLPLNSLVAVVLRNNQPIVPRGDFQFYVEDRLVLITLPENHGRIIKSFTGELI